MQVNLISHTPNPESVVAAAARLCYSNTPVAQLMEQMSDAESKRLVRMLADIGHESPMEHAVFTFTIEGVSRTMMAQITRHRMATFSVQSQRYVQLNNFEYITPPEIASDETSQQLFERAMQKQAEIYEELAQDLAKTHEETLIKSGVDEKTAHTKAQKMAIEDARFVLPNACATRMMVSMNARSLMNFFALRCCNRAQWEIREVAQEMLRLAYGVAPALFEHAGPACVSGKCTEGKMSCGEIDKVRAQYKLVKEQALGQ